MDEKSKNPVKRWFSGVADTAAKAYAESKFKEIAEYKISLKDALMIVSLAVSLTALAVTRSKVSTGMPSIIIIK